MIVTWMLYAVFVTALVALAARALESLGRQLGYAVRWVWVGALALTVVLVALVPFRSQATSAPLLRAVYREAPAGAAFSADRSAWAEPVREALVVVRRAVAAPVELAGVAARRLLPERAPRYASLGWAALSAALLALLIGVHARLRRARRGWPGSALQGVDVRVSPRTGPIVIGVVRPEIVIPRWLLFREPDEQRMVLAHEREHVRARDPLLLAFGCLVVVLLPWNPAVWWMCSRLRLTMELDCDARVLGAGATPLAYGTLLIDVAEQCAGLRIGSAALADDSTHLQERLMAITTAPRRFALVRGGAIAALAIAALAAACDTPLPTDAEVKDMDVASAERAAVRLWKLDSSATAPVYVVDGVRTSALVARKLAADSIQSVEVVKGGEKSEIRISTDRSGRLVKQKAALEKALVERERAKSSADGGTVTVNGSGSLSTFTGLVFVDGKRVPQSELRTLNPKDIESIEVIKGAAAERLYRDADAAKGVIQIHTKQAATPDGR